MRSLEETLLASADSLLNEAATTLFPDKDLTLGRMSVLEEVAGVFGGWDPAEFRQRFDSPLPVVDQPLMAHWASRVRQLIVSTEIPIPLAIASLSREVLSRGTKRTTGAYYTDWRLAQQLAGEVLPTIRNDGPWIDPSCGTGALLVASTMLVPAGQDRNKIIAESLIGADLSELALRGALIAIASLTDDLETVSKLRSHLFAQDSLKSRAAWREYAPSGAALVIGNPPWEKLKASRHEHARSKGIDRHYGESFVDDVDLSHSRASLVEYVDAVSRGTKFQGRGEPDLYKLFLELSIGLAADEGSIALILPAGLIRSQGTEPLRRALDSMTSEMSISVIENRARHFAIDTRFKFLTLTARVGDGPKTPLSLKVADRQGVLPNRPVKIDRNDLRSVRKDLSIPEIKTDSEFELFARLTKHSYLIGDPDGPWHPSYRREVDMTSDRWMFTRKRGEATTPLIEGRHVAQYRWRAKSYLRGEGRAAVWKPAPRGSDLRSQWFVHTSDLNPATAERVARSRIGFCDITGQTNERSMLTARIPAGVVCGNKVPTIALADGGEQRENLFLALSNTFVVDWMLRRLVTTTVNFFLLDSLPLPTITEETSIGKELVKLAESVTSAESNPDIDPWVIGGWRARADALVASEWGIGIDDMRTVLADFPLIDRGQTPLLGEQTSTITSDCVLSAMATIQGCGGVWQERCEEARDLGARPYVPAEYAKKKGNLMVSQQPLVPILVVYKEIMEGDRLKLVAESNISDSGGGARDLRFPGKQFDQVLRRIFTEDRTTVSGKPFRVARVTYIDADRRPQTTELEYWPPTSARPTEVRIAKVHASPALGMRLPDEDKGRVLIVFTLFSDGTVRCDYAYEEQLRCPNKWARELAQPILRCLDAASRRNSKRMRNHIPAQGYYLFQESEHYCHAE